jgi:hypothetical protein
MIETDGVEVVDGERVAPVSHSTEGNVTRLSLYQQSSNQISHTTQVTNGRLSVCADQAGQDFTTDPQHFKLPVYNAYFAARPRDPALAAVLRRVVAHVEAK